MYCPECGLDANEAKFCPECGNDLTAVGQAPRGRARGPAATEPTKGQKPRTVRRAAAFDPWSAQSRQAPSPGLEAPGLQPSGHSRTRGRTWPHSHPNRTQDNTSMDCLLMMDSLGCTGPR